MNGTSNELVTMVDSKLTKLEVRLIAKRDEGTTVKQQPDTTRIGGSLGNHRDDEWAVILAGGDGTRLKCLTRKIAGDERPKQFCSVLGNRTLLEETQRRAALELSPERTLYVVNRTHEEFYASILAREPAQNILVQPGNRGTAPAILYSVLRIAAIDPKAVVAFFPSDHYISDNNRFMAHIRTALDTARRKLDLIILLGLDPETPEVEYGWIEPSAPIAGHSGVFGVRRFWEKPNQMLAQVLQLRGCLWNTFVMVAPVQALLGLIESASPELYRSFACLSLFFGSSGETRAISKLYERIEDVNFSHRVLALRPERLAVAKVTGVRWNDLGEPKRVMASLNMAGVRPHWADVPQFV
jgi:mannose-1-phosphate guanylyltransferase